MSEANSSAQQIAKAEKPGPGSLIMSGMRTTHRLHFGNYFGALKSWLELQQDFAGIYGAMDWHAMTTKYKEPHEIQRLQL